MKVIYVAGKYRANHPYLIQENIDKAKELAKKVWAAGHAAICPHLNSINFEGLNTEQHFIDGTLELMRRCDAVLLVPGWKLSEGTLGEIEEAKRLKIPVFEELDECFKLLSDPSSKNNTYGWYGLPEQ
jgi:hypothetical protein